MAALTMSMAAAKPALVGSSKSAFKGSRVSAVAPKKVAGGRATLQVRIDAADDAARAPRRTPSDATDATRTIATRALTQRGDPVTVITPRVANRARSGVGNAAIGAISGSSLACGGISRSRDAPALDPRRRARAGSDHETLTAASTIFPAIDPGLAVQS